MGGEINDFLALIWHGREQGMDGGTVSVYGRVGCLVISSTTFSHPPYLLPHQLLEDEVTERKGKKNPSTFS